MGGLPGFLALVEPGLGQAHHEDEQREEDDQEETGIGDHLVVGLPVEALPPVVGQGGRREQDQGGHGGQAGGEETAHRARIL